MSDDRDLRAAFDENDHESFAAAAGERGAWLDALCESINESRRDAFTRWVEAHLVPDEYTEWLAREGPEAGVVAMIACRERFRTRNLKRENIVQEISGIVDAYVRVFGARAEGPWLAFEAISAIPVHKRLIAERQAERLRSPSRLGERVYPPMRAILAHARPRVAARRAFADCLLGEDFSGRALGSALAVMLLDDPELRYRAETFLTSERAKSEEKALRALYATTSGETQGAALRVLRKFDKTLTHTVTSLGKLEADLRTNPWDAAKSQVWADMLSQTGDPRGELVMLEHAIRAARPEDVPRLTKRQRALWREHGSVIYGEAGGFPFRERYTNHGLIPVRVDGQRVRDPETLLERARRFVTRFTNATGPAVVHLYRCTKLAHFLRPMRRGDCETQSESESERELLHLLDPAYLDRESGTQASIYRADLKAPLLNEASLYQFFMQTSPITIRWTFALTYPDTNVLLPHQDGEMLTVHRRRLRRKRHPLSSILQIAASRDNLAAGKPIWETLWLDLQIPFEDRTDPLFVAYVAEIKSALGVDFE